MNQHVEKLRSLCRLCGSKITLNTGYINPKLCTDYQDILKDHVLVDEDEQVFPKCLSNTCKKKLDKKKSGQVENIILPSTTFEPHSSNCKICFSQVQKRGKEPVALHANKLEKAFLKIGFSKISSREYRIFFKPEEGKNLSINVGITMKVYLDGQWQIAVNGNDIPKENELINTLPILITDKNVDEFCSKIESLSICTGIKDFQDVIEKRMDFRDPFPDIKGGSAAWIESNEKTKLSKQNFDTIRCRDCLYLVPNLDLNSKILCSCCNDFRKSLFVYRARLPDSEAQQKARTSDDSKTNFRYLQVTEMEERLRNLAKAKQDAVQKAAKYAVKIEKLIQNHGLKVSSGDHKLFQDILEKNLTSFEEGSPQQLLWQQQMEQAKCSNRKQMRWHPLIIRWCLSIYHTSPSAYRHISSKRNNFLVLPHVNTLKQYINFTNPSSGFNPDIIDQLVIDSDLENIPEFQKNVSLLFDEIKIKSGLVYKRSSGQLVGFTEMGNINDEINSFQRLVSSNDDDSNTRDFASYCNVFMVRGICSSLCYPFGYHAGMGFTADQLFPLVWEATHVLECLGFKVRAWVCDGASPNRKFFKINGEDIYWTWNLFDLSRKIYFISDAPHLIKTTRNNMENSHGNRNSKSLKLNGMDISWMHVVSVYEWDLGFKRSAPGLRRLHKLTEDHIRLSPRHRMKVKFATQVLSNSVASAMEQQGCYDRASTIKFIRMFDRAFDCLNVTHLFGGGKEDRLPYKSTEDPRFEFLENVIVFLDEWRDEVNKQPIITQDEKNRFCLSQQTDIGWHITIKSFIELCKLLLQEEGVKYILSEKFSQDPLEEHFARHRRSAGCNDNPSLIQFQQQEVALNLIKSPLISDLRGNTSGRPDSREVLRSDDIRLPRRKDPRKKSENQKLGESRLENDEI